MGQGDWGDDELGKLERLYVDEGVGPKDIAEILNRPVDSVKTKIQAKGWTRGGGKDKVPKVLTKEAEDNIIKNTAKEIAHDAKEVHDEIIRIGKYVYRNYSERARSKGVPLEEFIDQVVVFHVNYVGLVGEMERKIREQKIKIDRLTEYLSPVPYQMALIEEMVKQEGSKNGRIYSDQDIEKYLNSVNLILDIGGEEEDDGKS